MKLQGGGVGYYPTSGSPFVHLDVGNVRAWPRMTREQLVKLFPDGRTAHIPSDGKPLPGYQLALADLKRAHREAGPVKKRSFLAALFGRDKDADEAEDNSDSARDTAAPARIVSGKSAAPSPVVVASAVVSASAPSIPLPPHRPMYQIAATQNEPAPTFNPWPAPPAKVASLSPNEIINLRGLWEDPAASSAVSADTAERGITAARKRLAASLNAAAHHDTTAAIGPFNPGQGRLPDGVALAYAAQPGAGSMSGLMAPTRATVTTTGSGPVAHKPEEPVVTRARLTRPVERLDDPWLRGLVLTASVQESLVVTQVGDPDFASLAQFMQKPGSSLLMTFSHDPHPGVSSEHFSGSAVVFPAIVTFGSEPQHTASLQ
jgi:hypothetical protein